MKIKVLTISTCFIAILTAFLACSKESTGPDDNTPDFIYSENLVLPESDSAFVSVTIAGDTLVFEFDDSPDSSDFAVGKILAGSTGCGYLRRVVEEPVIAGNSATVITEQATIVDAVIKGRTEGSAALAMSSAALEKLDYEREVEIDGEIYTMKVRSETPGLKRIGATSDVDFTDIEITFEIGGYNAVSISIDSLIFSIDGDLDWKFALHDSLVDTVYFAIEQDYGVRFAGVNFEMAQTIPLGSQEIELTEIPFAPIVFAIGILPVVIMPSLELSFEASAALTISCETEVGSEAEISAGFTFGGEYIGGYWNLIWEKSLGGSGSVETDATRRITGELTEGLVTSFEFLFYGISGPGLYLTPYIYQEVGFPPLSMGVGAGIDGGLSYTFSILSIDIFGFSYSLVDYRYPFLEWEQDIPYPAELEYPPSGTTFVDTDFYLEWDAVVVADGYTVQVADDSVFSSPEVDEDIDSTLFEITSTLPDGIYFWRVNATGNGSISEWSEVRVFGVGDVNPPAPELIAPDSGASLSGLLPELQWESVTEAGSYQVQVSKFEDFHSTGYDTTVEGESFTPEFLETEIYFWRVRGISPEGLWGEWSEVWSFSTFFIHIDETGRCELSGQPREIAVDGNYAYIISQSALDVVDFSNPASPTLIGSWTESSYLTDVVKHGDYLYIAGGSDDGLILLDVSSPESPVLENSLDIGYSGIKLDLEYPYAYVHTSTGLKIIDVGDPSSLSLVGEAENLDNGEQDVVADGGIVLCGYDSYFSSFLGLHFLDVSDPTDPVFIGETGKSARNIAINGDLAYVAYALSSDQFAIYDISDPASLHGMYDGLISEYTCTSELRCIHYNDSRVITGQDDPYIIEIIDVSDPEEPYRLAYFDGEYSDGVRCVDVSGYYILTGTTGSDFVIYEMD